jgi:acyl transferase domain-containing protein/glutamate-1-semialdehyde aminotransferase/acyl carrier protein
MTSKGPTLELPENSLAVVGMTGRFPGAKSVDEYWDALCAGRESITYFEDSELDPTIPAELRYDPNYVRAKGIVDDCDKFDASFFGISPLEAMLMDPQQRLMMEMAWELIEASGYVPSTFDGLIGLYAGMNWNRYERNNVWKRPDVYERFGANNTSFANEVDFLTTRISYKLNLKGPSVNIITACSTSLVAIAQASQSLLSYECDLAVAGGVSISVPVKSGYVYQEGGMLSQDGHCRTFDAAGTGTTFNDGAGLVALRRLEDAVADRDRIYAVIRGFATNNDGSDKVSFTAPSVAGQAEAIRSAIEFADIDPATIGFVETHGTATPLGDPIEVAALKRAFGPASANKRSCAIGSAKTNVGHLVHAAGVAGFIKAALAVHHGKIPANINFDTPNPKLDLNNSCFYVNTELEDWQQKNGPRRAGVSSFGVGGTNAHVILEQAPDIDDECADDDELQVLCVSAKTSEALDRQLDNLGTWLECPPEPATLRSVAYTLQCAREAMEWRAAWVSPSIDDAATGARDKRVQIRGNQVEQLETAFMFTGQGAQRLDMGLALYKDNPTFRKWFDKGIAVLQDRFDFNILELLFSENNADESLVEQTKIAQPALFMYEFSLAQALIELGVRPQALVGHSIGELVAAAIAGVWSFEDGLILAAERGAAMQKMEPGSMLVLYCGEDEALQYAQGSLSLAGVNAPELCVISGPTKDIEGLCTELESQDVPFKPLRTSHAFHSSMMDQAVVQLQRVFDDVEMRAPTIPIFSTATGQILTDTEATDPGYWSSQIRLPVMFAAAVESLAESGQKLLVEVGPGTTLATLANQSRSADKLFIRSASPGAGSGDEASRELLDVVAEAWVHGVSVDLASRWISEKPRRALLPTYPFARDKHWVDPPANELNVSVIAPTQAIPVETEFSQSQPEPIVMSDADRISVLCQRILAVFEDTSGYDLGGADTDASYTELGFDSLLLTQASTALKKAFSTEVTFRELMEDFTTIGELAEYFVDKVELDIPDSTPVVGALPQVVQQPMQMASVNMNIPNNASGSSSEVQDLINKQLVLMQQQLLMLSGVSGQVVQASQTPQPAAAVPVESAANTDKKADEAESTDSSKKKLTPGTRIQKSRDLGAKLTRAQQAFIDKLESDYTEATAGSKKFVQEHRRQLADPRTASGFTPALKEMVYPIVTERSKGSKVWDVDGNEYIDLTNGFGPIFFGHSPEFVNEAVIKQIEAGVETGPQTQLAGEVAELFCELTGLERVAFASTGSEAVLAALRLARAVTGRDKVVVFDGSYHGIFDEVVVRPGKNGAGLPAATGIPREMTQNIVVLPYGTDESLEVIRSMAGELAAVMTESVQSRHPELRPGEFLKEIRQITEDSGTAFIFDEVVTGFRVHPGGAQAYYGIEADIATYGKVIGGGYPIGLIGGKAKYLDALDGGYWQYGDDSIPEVGVTFFAGTFVRHPLALAATKAVLLHLKEKGPELQESVAENTLALVNDLRNFVESIQAKVTIEQFSSWFFITVSPDEAHGGLLFYLLRLYGLHTWEFRPCFFTTTHSSADAAKIKDVFVRAVSEMVSQGLLAGDVVALSRSAKEGDAEPPVEGAKLGKDRSGMPAWFIPDPERPGKYIQVDSRRAS